MSRANAVMKEVVPSLPTAHVHWTEYYLLSLAWGILAEHRYTLDEPDVEEALRFALDAALHIDAPMDSVRGKALAELADRALLTESPTVLEELVEIAQNVDSEYRDTILLAWSKSLAADGRLEEVVHTVERMEDDTVRAMALAWAIRMVKSPDLDNWLVGCLLPRLDALVPGLGPREELVTIIGGALSHRPDVLLSCLKDVISYPNAGWVWLAVLQRASAVPEAVNGDPTFDVRR